MVFIGRVIFVLFLVRGGLFGGRRIFRRIFVLYLIFFFYFCFFFFCFLFLFFF